MLVGREKRHAAHHEEDAEPTWQKSGAENEDPDQHEAGGCGDQSRIRQPVPALLEWVVNRRDPIARYDYKSVNRKP